MIEIKKLSKSFGKQVVLDQLDLIIPDGQITVIIGRSGEGKSVLLKHITGLVAPDSGEVLLDGKSITKATELELHKLRRHFGVLFQNAALFDSMSVFDNVAFPLWEHAHLSKEEITQKVRGLLALVGLEKAELKMPSELSGGMRKRAGLARAIALSPDVLLYDEPTTGLDPILTDSIDKLIVNTQKKLGITSIVISHDIHAIFKIADKVAMLHQGKIILEGAPQVFKETQNPIVRQFLEGRSEEKLL